MQHYGNLVIKEIPELTLWDINRFWLRVNKTDTCWLWTAHINDSGYGVFTYYKTTQFLAHRLSYTIHQGKIPDRMLVLHNCDTPACVNPSHLYLGTQKENNKDVVNRNRTNWAKGTSIGNAVLIDSDIPEIRTLYNDGYTYAEIGRVFGVSRRTIGRVVEGETWKHIQ